MPDRELTEEETRKFVQEHVTSKVFDALKLFKEEKTKPSLHDLCLLELEAKIEGMKRILKEIHEIKDLLDKIEELVKKNG